MKNPESCSVLFVIPSLGNGGAERVVVDLANSLPDEGIDVGIVTYKPDGEYTTDLRDCVKIHCLHTRAKTLVEQFIAVKRLRSLSKQYDVIISGLEMGTDQVVSWCSIFDRISQNPKQYMAMVHIALLSYPRFLRRPGTRKKLSRIYRRFDKVISVSNGVHHDMEIICGQHSKNLVTICNPVDINRVNLNANENIDTSELEPYFLNVGRLDRQKDQSLLIHAFNEFICKTGASHHLVILGRGEMLKDLQFLCHQLDITDRVHFLGFNPYPCAYMKKATALISSSIYEGWSLVIAEAMTCKLPVIATNCPYGPAELLDNGANGWLVPLGSTESIVESMEDVAFQKGTITSRVERARKYIEQFSLPQVSKKYASLFKSAVGNAQL